MNAIVTGGTGFIGSWLILELINNNYDVTVIARNKTRLCPEILQSSNCTVIEKAIEEVSSGDFAQDTVYDIFFHLGWGGVNPEQKNNVDLQLNNVSIAIKALEICGNIGCKKFVSSGTVAEYVFCDDVMNVNEKQTPNDMYGAAKVSTHYFLEVRARQLQIPFIWIIIPSTFGERRKDSNIISYTIKTLLRGKKPLYGNLQQMWDFLYVGEVVRAIRLIGKKGKTGKIYGIGSGDYRPLSEYITKIRDLIDPSLELGIGEIPSMTKQTFSSCVNIYDLKKDTGFTPSVSFDDGIVKTIEYFRNHSD